MWNRIDTILHKVNKKDAKTFTLHTLEIILKKFNILEITNCYLIPYGANVTGCVSVCITVDLANH